MIKLALFAFFSFALFIGATSAQSVSTDPESRTSHYICDLEVSLAANDASSSIVSGTTQSMDISAVESQAKSKIKTQKRMKNKNVITKPEHHAANLIGRGVANCKNQQGFQFNLPALVAIGIQANDQIPLESLRATVQPISVERDVNRIFDHYTPHLALENTPSTMPNAATERAVVVKGQKNDVLLQVNLNFPSEFTSKVRISQVDLKFDNEAPSLSKE